MEQPATLPSSTEILGYWRRTASGENDLKLRMITPWVQEVDGVAQKGWRETKINNYQYIVMIKNSTAYIQGSDSMGNFPKVDFLIGFMITIQLIVARITKIFRVYSLHYPVQKKRVSRPCNCQKIFKGTRSWKWKQEHVTTNLFKGHGSLHSIILLHESSKVLRKS
jgi:hypothetical protein